LKKEKKRKATMPIMSENNRISPKYLPAGILDLKGLPPCSAFHFFASFFHSCSPSAGLRWLERPFGDAPKTE